MTAELPHLVPSRKTLLFQLGGSAVVAAVIAVFVVLPAEYQIDPTGFGALTGLDRISAPPEIIVETRMIAPPEIVRTHETPFRTDTVSITVGALREQFGELEYKITMAAGDSVSYAWRASGPIYYEFHGHTQATPENPVIEVMEYQTDEATEAFGTLTAPRDGIHGWYFANSAFDESVVIELTLSGYYELAPGIVPLEQG